MKEAPVLAQLKQTHGDKVNFISLTVEAKDTSDLIAQKMNAPGLRYARASDDAWAKLTKMGGLEQVLPTTVFLDANGEVKAAVAGRGGLEEALAKIL